MNTSELLDEIETSLARAGGALDLAAQIQRDLAYRESSERLWRFTRAG